MRKNLFRDWSKSDFGYALKIIANVVLTTASVVFTLNVSSSYLWQSIILGIVFLIGSFYTEYCSLSFRSDTYIGNALYLRFSVWLCSLSVHLTFGLRMRLLLPSAFCFRFFVFRSARLCGVKTVGDG